MPQVHATAVTLDDGGVLITGPSGAGKSDLALRLIDEGARLVADDRCDLAVENDAVVASAPANLAGMIEVRGVGILVFPHEARARIDLVCELVAPEAVARLPDAETATDFGAPLPIVRLAAFEASATAKLRAALGQVRGRIASAV